MGKIKKVIWLGDQHVPDHDVLTNKAVLHYVEDAEPDLVILGGDVLDMTCLGGTLRRQFKQVEGKRIQKEFDAGNRYLDEVQQAANYRDIVLLEGNHEYRVQRWINENPTFEGFLDVPRGLKLTERGIKWIPSWSKTQVYKIGKASFIHGLYVGEYHAKKMVQTFGSNIFYGHMHDISSHSFRTIGDNSTKLAQSLGCLCNYKQYYLQGRPTNWQQAFGEFHFRADGFFNHYVCSIFNHTFVAPTGELYKP